MLPVSEVFETIQGEATNAGTPAVFIRLQGCPVGCPWCDTKYTWDTFEADRMAEDEAIDSPGSPLWYLGSVDRLVAKVAESRADLAVITGGEPCLYDLTELTSRLMIAGKRVQIETSGTHEVLCHDATWVTVSPKIDMPGGFVVKQSAMQRANEIKMPVGRLQDVSAMLSLMERCNIATWQKQIWLQPLSLSDKATALCIQQATLHGWRVSLQAHALAGVR
jgi:7-carboxy-7-deazaguanine synthase